MFFHVSFLRKAFSTNFTTIRFLLGVNSHVDIQRRFAVARLTTDHTKYLILVLSPSCMASFPRLCRQGSFVVCKSKNADKDIFAQTYERISKNRHSLEKCIKKGIEQRWFFLSISWPLALQLRSQFTGIKGNGYIKQIFRNFYKTGWVWGTFWDFLFAFLYTLWEMGLLLMERIYCPRTNSFLL